MSQKDTNQKTTVSVLFVCMGNICRSPMAEGVFLSLLERHRLSERIMVDSAGTHAYDLGEAPDARARQTAMQRGIDLTNLRAERESSGETRWSRTVATFRG